MNHSATKATGAEPNRLPGRCSSQIIGRPGGKPKMALRVERSLSLIGPLTETRIIVTKTPMDLIFA
jgi:hypothetical protein